VEETTTGAAAAADAAGAADFTAFLDLGSATTGAGAAGAGVGVGAADFFGTLAGAVGLEEEGVVGIIPEAEEVFEDILRGLPGL